MAIDNREKRQSAAWLLPISPPSVTPNMLADQEWRQQAGWGYSGIVTGGVPPSAVTVSVVVASAWHCLGETSQ